MAKQNRLMKDHLCIHEREFGELSASLPRIEEKIDTLYSTVLGHTAGINNLINYQASHNGEAKGKKDAEVRQQVAEELKLQTARDNRSKRMGWIMAGIAFIGVLTGIYFGFRNLNKNIKSEIKTEIQKMK